MTLYPRQALLDLSMTCAMQLLGRCRAPLAIASKPISVIGGISLIESFSSLRQGAAPAMIWPPELFSHPSRQNPSLKLSILWSNFKDAIIRRTDLQTRLQLSILSNPVTVLYGPRQCGKTTLAREVAERAQAHYFDLDDPGGRPTEPTRYVSEASWSPSAASTIPHHRRPSPSAPRVHGAVTRYRQRAARRSPESLKAGCT